MKKIKKMIAFLLIVNILLGLVPGFWQSVFAAPTPLNVYVQSYAPGNLTIHWDPVPGATGATISYKTPDALDNAQNQTIILPDPTVSTWTLPNIQNDYIYEITVDIADGGSGWQGSLKVLPQISFYAEAVAQQHVSYPTGGSEIGVMPALKLSWKMPKVFNGVGSFVYAHNNPVNIDPAVTDLNFIVNVNNGSELSNININYNGADYKASCASDPSIISDVKFDAASGMVTMYLLGRKDDHVTDITTTDIPNSIPPADHGYILRNPDILPGTVYDLKIKTALGGNPNALTPALDAGSPLLGSRSYIYTPVRFELTKDSLDNVYVKIFKVNQGSLNMPRLYYLVQTNDQPIDQDSTWKDRKRLDDTYFNGEYAYTVITGINVNNTVYYRVIVKSDGSTDRIGSDKLPYVIKDDASLPPVPKNVYAVPAGQRVVTASNVKTSDISISWEKPANWDQIKSDPTKEVYFNITLCTMPESMDPTIKPVLESEGINYGNYSVDYRLVKYVSSSSPNIKLDDTGTRLIYTLKGDDLFTWEDSNGHSDGHPLSNSDGYPAFLLPNKVYYLQMYTAQAVDLNVQSEKSVSTSFTTLSSIGRDVPLPINVTKGLMPPDTDKKPYLEVQFDKVQIDPLKYISSPSETVNLYYDIYMSTRMDPTSFMRVATTQYTGAADTDAAFTGHNDTQSIFVRAKLKNFTDTNKLTYRYDDNNDGTLEDHDPVARFGPSIMNNTTYYLLVKTRLVIHNTATNTDTIKESISTQLLPITTERGDVNNPNNDGRKPLAPSDFAIAKDTDGNLMVTGQTVTFEWTKAEDNATYTLICTSKKVNPNDDTSVYGLDSNYLNFNAQFRVAPDTELVLNPINAANGSVFTYDNATNKFRYTINRWLIPNKLYYFSLKSNRIFDSVQKSSAWVSIPVTTSQIEAPSQLSAVNDAEIGFWWRAGNTTLRAEDLRINIMGPKDKAYRVLSRAQCTVTADTRAEGIPPTPITYFYVRAYNLEPNTQYRVKIEQPTSTPGVYSTAMAERTLVTRDAQHQIEVKWKGRNVSNSYGYELAIKTADASEYTTVAREDLELYTDRDNTSYPYYYEKTTQTVGTDYNIYYARVKTITVTLPDGTIEKRPLKANMKYYIKVRAVNTSISATPVYSKYIGPIDTRTEFSQSDYDSTDQETKKKAAFLDKVSRLEEKPYWRVDMSNSTLNKLLLKGERMVNAIRNTSSSIYTLDVSGIAAYINIDVIYMPISVIKVLETEDKSLVVKMQDSEYTFKPDTLKLDEMPEYIAVKNKTGVKDGLVKLTAARSTGTPAGLPLSSKLVSKVYDFKVEVIGSSKTDKDLKELFNDKLYNDQTGLIKRKSDTLMSTPPSTTDTQQKLDKYTDALIKEVESELSDYINDNVEGGRNISSLIVSKDAVKAFTGPMDIKLAYSDPKGIKSPYVYYNGDPAWKKITGNVTAWANTLVYNVHGPGKYLIASASSIAFDMPDDYWAKDAISSFASKYDLSGIFGGVNNTFNPDETASVEEIILLYAKITGKTDRNSGLDIKQKAKLVGLDSIFNLNGIKKDAVKQECASVLIKLYFAEMGLNADGISIGTNIDIKDENKISDANYNSVVLSVQLEILELDENGMFNPNASVTRAQVISAFVKLLGLTGDM